MGGPLVGLTNVLNEWIDGEYKEVGGVIVRQGIRPGKEKFHLEPTQPP